MLRWILIFFIAVICTACGANSIDAYKQANQQYACGQYKKAFANYLYAAKNGIVQAQYAVGYQYFYGQGIKMDQLKATQWFQRAAPNSPDAQYALSLIEQKRTQEPWTLHIHP